MGSRVLSLLASTLVIVFLCGIVAAEESSSLTELSTDGSVKHRSKRFIAFNVQAPFFVGLLLSIPITLILPSMAGIFNNLRKKRSPVVEEPEDYEDSPFIQPNLEKMAGYFDLLQITEQPCKERAVCEMSASPSKYFPISELLLKQISVPSRYTFYDVNEISSASNTTSSRVKRSLFGVYTKSADHGIEKGENQCDEKFKDKCPYNLESRLNMPVLKFWQALASILKLTFSDEH